MSLQLTFISIILSVSLNTFQCQNFNCSADSLSFGSKCYHIVNTNLDWESAEIFCNSFTPNGHLAAISDAYLNNFLANTIASMSSLSSQDVWIGGSDKDDGHTWTWIDGSQMMYTNWQPGYPNSNAECMAMNVNANFYSFWTNQNCELTKIFVCQTDASISPSTSTRLTTSSTASTSIRLPTTSTSSPSTSTRLPTTPSNPCPTSRRWVYFALTRSCYLLMQNNYYWQQAQETCVQNGGNLTSIHSEDENDFITDLVHRQNPHLTWIGLIDRHDTLPHVFRWVDDNSGLDYTNWYSTYPSQIPSMDCVYMSVNNAASNGKWENGGCSLLLLPNFVCKRPAFI